MKKLLLLATILLTTLSSFSQTDTSKTLPALNNLEQDSLICLPKTLTLYMVRDLVYLDECRYEVEHYSNLAAKYAAFIEKQDTVIEIIRKKEVNCQKDLMTCNELRDSLELQNTTLQKNLKTKTRAKRFWLVTALAAATSAILVHYSWKGDL